MDFINIFASLIALTVLEIILGIDNLVFLSILTTKLPVKQRAKARRWGLTFAWVTRLILLASVFWLSKLTKPLFFLLSKPISVKDMILFFGGSFLIAKATTEIRQQLGEDEHALLAEEPAKLVSFHYVVFQVAIMDIIFSLDSVMTAIGLSNYFWVMAAAITLAIIVMIYASEPVSRFIEKYPTIKMLALSFLILIGTVLVADSFSFHIPRGYIYFAMGFSLSVEALNLIKTRKHRLHRKTDHKNKK